MVRMLTLDRLVSNGRVAPDWPDALRKIDKSIDAKIDACVNKLKDCGPYLPSPQLLWRAFEMPLANVRVLIVGQDPYPDQHLATGIAFSTGPGGAVSDSLTNIYGELRGSVRQLPSDGNLEPWTKEGVLLLNRSLTIPRLKTSKPRVHFSWWSPLLRATLGAVARDGLSRPIVSLLWGVPAIHLRKYLEPNVKVFASSHPSPKSAEAAAADEIPFVGSRPFSRVDAWFASKDPKAPPINWELVP